MRNEGPLGVDSDQVHEARELLSDLDAAGPSRSVPVRAADELPVFDAFISYSHAADNMLAPALRLGLERITKPWYGRRALNVYLDTSGLEVTPTLWTTISAALARTRFLVLLCSPDAAKSEWVEREVRYWLEQRSAMTILPVVTEGTWKWDEQRSRIDPASTAVPPILSEAFAESPRYLDLRWARTETDLDLHHPRFRDDVAELAAPIMGKAKSEIEGEDIRQHRRTLRVAWSAAAALAVLLVVAVLAAALATINGNEAAQQRDVATSRLLAAQSTARQVQDPQLATLLALAAGQIDETDEAWAAMLRMVEHDKRIVGFLGGHAGIVETAAFSPDGSLVATAGPGDPVRLWDVTRRAVVGELPAQGAASIAFTPDGRTLAVAEPERLSLWDITARTLRSEIRAPVFSLAISADGSRLIGGSTDGTVTVYDLHSTEQIARLSGLAAQVTGIAISPNGRFAAGGDFDGVGLLWDVETGAEIARTSEFPSETKGKAAFSPDGTTLAMSRSGGSVLLLSTADRVWRTVEAHSRTVNGLTFLDTDTLISSSINGSVGRWSIPTSDRWERYVAGPITMTTGSVIAPDGRTVLSGNFDGTAVLWRLDADWSTRVGTLDSAATTAVDPTGTWITTIDESGSMAEVTSTDGTTLLRIPQTVAARSVALDSSGRLAVGHADGTVTMHRLPSGAVERSVRGAGGAPIVDLAFSPDGTLLAASEFSGTTTVWTTADGAEYDVIRPLPDVTDTAGIYTHVAFSPDGRTLAYSSLGNGLRLRDIATRSDRAELRGDSSIGTASVAFSPDGALLAQGGVDTKIVLWDPAHPEQQVAVLTGQTTAVFGLSFGPGGILAAGTADNGGVAIWNVARRVRQGLIAPGSSGTEPDFLPNTDTLLISDLGGVHRYDLESGRMREILCNLVDRDLTATEWNAYVVGRDQRPLCP